MTAPIVFCPAPKGPPREKKARAPIPRAGRPKATNAARKKREFARAYGSSARVAWVHAQRCIVAHARDCDGLIENAHIVTGGAGRKADAAAIVPLCHRHHHELHMVGADVFQWHRCVRLSLCADDINRAWLAHCEAGQ